MRCGSFSPGGMFFVTGSVDHNIRLGIFSFAQVCGRDK